MGPGHSLGSWACLVGRSDFSRCLLKTQHNGSAAGQRHSAASGERVSRQHHQAAAGLPLLGRVGRCGYGNGGGSRGASSSGVCLLLLNSQVIVLCLWRVCLERGSRLLLRSWRVWACHRCSFNPLSLGSWAAAGSGPCGQRSSSRCEGVAAAGSRRGLLSAVLCAPRCRPVATAGCCETRPPP